MNNSNQNSNIPLDFSLRYLIKETEEDMPSSWCSEGEGKVIVQSKPILQYTVDGIKWVTVDTVTEKE